MSDTSTASPARSRVVRRHGLFTRAWHWINALCLLVLLMSGLQIFNAHPSLYWGSDSNFNDPVLSIGAQMGDDGNPMGYLAIAGWQIPTTGVLGYSGPAGERQARAFPAWATLPDSQWLSLGRQWHFTAAWVFGLLLVGYLFYSVVSRRRRRLIGVHRGELGQFGRAFVEHAKLKFEHRARYNIIQKLTYLMVLGVLLPLMILTGLTMAPAIDAAWPWLTYALGGRQTARTIHFIAAFSLVGFFVVHLALVLLSGVINNMRAITTGGYRIDADASASTTERDHD